MKVLLLGSGELGREVAIEFIRRGCYVIAADRYENAPAMSVAQEFQVLNMNVPKCLSELIDKIKPDVIVPEIEAIATEVLIQAESDGINIVPSARAANLTMNREGIREFACGLGVPTSGYFFATTFNEIKEKIKDFTFPVIIKPVQSSSGKGQTLVEKYDDLEKSFNYAIENSRGDSQKVIIEEFIKFDYEITLLTVNAVNGITFVPPIQHRQENGDYQESWQGIEMDKETLKRAQEIAGKVVTALAATATNNSKGYGIYGVELFIRGKDVIFSEVSPRPHDTGMVTLISQIKSEFALHVEAILGYPIDTPIANIAASKAIVMHGEGAPNIGNISSALTSVAFPKYTNMVYDFDKPIVNGERRCGVILSLAESVDKALEKAKKIHDKLELKVTKK